MPPIVLTLSPLSRFPSLCPLCVGYTQTKQLPSSRAKPSDADMMTSLLKRLQQLETELKAKSSQLQLAAQENDALRGKLRSAETELLQRNSVSAAQLEGKAVAHLQAENSRLR